MPGGVVKARKPLLEVTGLGEEVQLRASEGAILISAASGRRDGWARAAQLMHQRGEDGLLDTAATMRFDRAEWKW